MKYILKKYFENIPLNFINHMILLGYRGHANCHVPEQSNYTYLQELRIWAKIEYILTHFKNIFY